MNYPNITDRPIDTQLPNWRAETDDFYMRYEYTENPPSDNAHLFYVQTKKYYAEGQRYQIFHLTDEVVTNEPESVIIEILSGMMREMLEFLIVQGVIKERTSQ